jgi:hypothetical protein
MDDFELALSKPGRSGILSRLAENRKIAVANAIHFENLKRQIRIKPPCPFYPR